MATHLWRERARRWVMMIRWVMMMMLGLALGCEPTTETQTEEKKTVTQAEGSAETVHGFTLDTIEGTSEPLSQYAGKVLLMVNVASQCGFTPQYEGLQKLHETYGDKGLVVMGIPANEFGGQEPGSDEEIKGFCESRFNVTFPMYSKIVVKGEGQHPLYAHLTSKGGAVTWNFNKFLVGKDGKLIKRYESKVKPQSPELVGAIETALAR